MGLVNAKVFDFMLLHLLGEGGMAEVWYAENDIGKSAAIKILHKDMSFNETIVHRFKNEAKIMVKLNHPNIRQVYNYATIDNRPCIVMEYLQGKDLKHFLNEGSGFTDEQLQTFWNQMVDALNYTHKQNVIHRDIKPSNIFLTNNGQIKLLDFGIAKVRDSITLTKTGTQLGTLMYMSPEQVEDTKNIDFRTDVYSLAVTFYHLLTGKAPYDISNSNERKILNAIADEHVDLLVLPSHWQVFLKPYLSKEPAHRPELNLFNVSENSVHSESFIKDPAITIDIINRYDDCTLIEAKKPSTILYEQKSKSSVWFIAGTFLLIIIAFLLWQPLKIYDKLSVSDLVETTDTTEVKTDYLIAETPIIVDTFQRKETETAPLPQKEYTPIADNTNNSTPNKPLKKNEPTKTKSPNSGTFRDYRDFNIYKWVKIGDQIWMAENLNYSTGSISWCYDNDINNCSKYGRLYKWNTAITVCPDSWHLPSEAEWGTLLNFAGIYAGTSLKAVNGWSSGGNGSDKYGFAALPGGSCDFAGSFGYINNYGYWWTSTESSTPNAYYYNMYTRISDVVKGASSKEWGFSVRCIKDE